MKKCISMLLTLLMMLTIIPTAFADSSYSQPCVVDYFNSFNGFEKQAGTYDVPDGLEKFLQANWAVTNLTSQSDGVNDYLKFSGNGSTALMLPFDETIRTGKLHMSFDLKIEDYTKLYRFYVYAHDNRENDNPLDLTYDVTDKDGNPVIDDKTGKQKIEYSYIQLFDMGITDRTYQKLTLRGNVNKQIDIAEKIKNEWHKYDLEIDFTQTPYKVVLTIDGNNRTESTLPYGLKSLYFFYTPGSGDNAGRNTPIYMDNLFVKHYPNGTYGGTEMRVDYAGSTIANKNVSVDVSFSEASSVVNDGNVPMESEFVAQNIIDNTETKPITAVKKDSNIRLTFDNLAAGTYRIVCKNPSDYIGLFTQGQPSYSDTFSTAGTAQNVKEQNILVEDDFENYTGGIPANAESLGGSKSHWTDKIHAATGNGGGTALEIKEQQVIYQFPYALTGGKFSYEFDVKHDDGGWYTGILTADAFSGKKSLSEANYKKVIDGKTTLNDALYTSDLQAYKNQTNAIGCSGFAADPRNSAPGVETVQYVKTKGWVDTKIDGLTCLKDTWNHIKVDVDLDACTYTITIDEQEPKTVDLDANRFRPSTRYMKKTVNGEEKWVKTWDYGVKAVSLGCLGARTKQNETDSTQTGSTTPTVLYDNFKVYTDNSYNDYQTFDAGARTAGIGLTAGWVKQLYPHEGYGITPVGEGRNYSETNTGDKSLKIDALHWHTFSHQFNRPIAANTPFEMEFDIKGDENNLRQQYNFRLLTKDQIYSTYENTPINAVPRDIVGTVDGSTERGLLGKWTKNAEGKDVVSLTLEEELKQYNGMTIFATRSLDTNNGKDNVRVVKENGSHNWVGAEDSKRWLAEDSTDTNKKEIPFDIIGKWAHVKLSGYPKGGKMAFVLSVTDESGNTKTSQEFVSIIPSTTEFAAFGINPASTYSGSGIVYLDNFTVKETNPVSKAYVTGVNAVDVSTGERANLKSDGLRTNGDSIEISFSEPISEDTISNIKIYQGNPVKYISTTATLSTDKKTVTLTPKSIPTVGEKYMLEIPQTVKTAAASNLSIVKPKAVAFTINNKTGTAELKVEDFRLYKYYEAGANESVVYAANWVPVADTELKDLTTDDKFKFIAKGYNTNTGDPIKLWLGRAEKDPTTALLTNFDNQTATANYGKFEVALPEFTMENTNGSLETYLWESAGLRPLCGKYVFSVTKTPTEATE